MTQPDPGQRLTAALAALCDPTVVRVDRLATTDHDRDAVRATNAEAAANHRDQIAFYRRDLARYQAQGNDAGIRRVTALIKHRETVHRAAVEQRRTAEAVVPSLLERLHDAVESTQGGGGASAGVHRSPIGISAAELLHAIAAAIAWSREQPLEQAIRAWVLDQDAPLVEKWVKDGQAIIEPSRIAELPGACPKCGTERVLVEEEGETIRKWALSVNLTSGDTTCLNRSCGHVWDRAHAPLLAAAVRQDIDERKLSARLR